MSISYRNRSMHTWTGHYYQRVIAAFLCDKKVAVICKIGGIVLSL
jgi:hypothetical protein